MNNDFARGKCPICGCATFYRKNKNGIIYTYCPIGHHAKLDRMASTAASVAICGGKPWNNGIIYLYPMKGFDNGNNETSIGTIGNQPLKRRNDGTDTAVCPRFGNTGDDDEFGIFGL